MPQSISAPDFALVNTMILLVISCVALAANRRFRRIEDLSRDKEESLLAIEEAVGACKRSLKAIEVSSGNTQVVQVDDSALIKSIDRVAARVDERIAEATGDFTIDTTLWFQDGEAFSKTLRYEFRPLVDETVLVALDSDGLAFSDCLPAAVFGSFHGVDGSLSIEASTAGDSRHYREALLGGGWVPCDSDEGEVGDVQVRDRGAGDGQGQGVPGHAGS